MKWFNPQILHEMESNSSRVIHRAQLYYVVFSSYIFFRRKCSNCNGLVNFFSITTSKEKQLRTLHDYQHIFLCRKVH